MTPQETQLVNDLFDRLAALESAPRDAAAERLMTDGLQRAPHAVYALVQTALVQDEALKRANAHIAELQAQMSGDQGPEQAPASFLDSVREAFGGRAPARGSVPSVRPAMPVGYPPQSSQSADAPSQSFQPQPGYPPPPEYPPSGYPGGTPLGSGGSFLGTAASAAAGMIGGALLLDGIRSMFGHHAAGPGATFGGFANASPGRNTTDPGAANSDLARDLGANQISNSDDNTRDSQSDDVDSVASTDDDYNADDNDDSDNSDDGDFGDDDSGADDSGGDSYDV